MTASGREAERFSIRLLPHQVAFVETFFDPASKRVVVLRAQVGLGKSITLAALASRLLQERPTARVLFVVPGAALRAQCVETLRRGNTPALVVDRYEYRERLDLRGEDEIWPRGTVAVLSGDFARQPDIMESLAKAHWDMVCADEAHWFKGARGEVFARIGKSADRVVLASAVPDIPLLDTVSAEDVSVVVWRRDQMVDQGGKPFDAVPRPSLHEVPFSLNGAERHLVETVGTLCRLVETGAPQHALAAKVISRSSHSSPPALEAVLQSFLFRTDEQSDADAIVEVVEGVEYSSTWGLDPATASQARAIAGRALQEIEVIQTDSKLNAFGELLSHLVKATTPAIRICVLSGYRGTVYYLASEIEGRGLSCRLLHGGMAFKERYESLRMFSDIGGILVATAGMTEGVDPPEVTDLVLYDVPFGEVALQQALGRFDRFGRLSQLNIHVLLARDGADGVASGPLRLLKEILVGGAGADATP